MHEMPAVITHNYDPRRGALQNLCNLPRADAEALLSEIRLSCRPSIKPNYLERRLDTERWLLDERTKKLGAPRLSHPIYFFLGDFADGLDPSRPCSLMIPLAALPAECLTFTYFDSMTNLPMAAEEASDGRPPYHAKLFTLPEIKEAVARFGLPIADEGNEGLPRPFIEVQVWDDRPVRTYLAKHESL